MAFERLEPWGWPLLRVLIDWGRSLASLLCSAAGQTQISRDKMPDVSVAADVESQEEDCHELAHHSAPADSDSDLDDAARQPTSADILRAITEQNQFRF